MIDLLVLPGFFTTAVTVTVDVIATANLLAQRLEGDLGPITPLSHRLLSIDGRPVRGSTGLALAVDGAWDAASAPLALAFGVGMADPELAVCGAATPDAGKLAAVLARRHAAGSLVAASCSSTFLLAEAGLLDGGAATTSWWLGPTFKARYPTVELVPDAIVTEHNRVLCAGAAMAQLDLALHLVGRLASMDLARAVARYMVFDDRRSSQAPYLIVDHLTRHDPVVAQAQRLIHERLATQLELDELAREVGVSPRTLLRRFVCTTGLSPARFVRRLRAESAATLLRTTDWSIARVADEVGYVDESALRRAFQDHFRVSPSSYRRTRLVPVTREVARASPRATA